MSSPAKSRWSRVGTAVRRASTLVAPRSSSSDLDDAASIKGSTKGSIKGINTTPAPAPASPPVPEPKATIPSPIAESPAREAASSEGDPLPAPASSSASGPSPLAQAPLITSTVKAPVPETELTPTSPQGYVPPPLLDSSAVGPGAFTDDPDELPQPQVIQDPSLVQPEPTKESPQVLVVDPPVEDSEALVESPVEESFPELAVEAAHPPETVVPESEVEPVVVEPQVEAVVAEPQVPVEVAVIERAVQVPVTQEVAPVQPATPAEPVGEAASYFNLPVQEEVIGVPPQPEESKIAVEEKTLGGGVGFPIPHEQSRALDQTEVFTPSPRSMSTPLPEQLASVPVYPVPVYDVHEVWGGAAHKHGEEPRSTMTTMNGYGSPRTIDSSIRMSEDPFADPVVPRIAVSHQPEMPRPYDIDQQPQGRSREHTPGGVVMPLPVFNEVIPSRSLHEFPSTDSVNASRPNLDTDETRPLLSGAESFKNNYLQPSAAAGSAVNVNVSPQLGMPSSSVWPAQASGSGPRLHDLGWIEYHLPDGTAYYVHPTRRVTTDVDMRVDSVLDIVTAFLERQKNVSVLQGMEMWIRGSLAQKSKSKSRQSVLVPVRCWVDHKKRVVQFDRANEANGSAKGKNVEADDHLDMEYRYWSFMEAHPAHTSLPVNAKIEAMDVLTWAWTDRLLPSHRTVPAPFTQDECQELMTLLRSNEQNDTALQTVVQTRIVSRILLRVAHWRQQHFRPNKPLPKDVVNNPNLHFPKHRKTVTRALFDLVLSCVCLGIPYIFFERNQQHRLDEESGLRSSAPMFVIGACTCLIAAILLSASVTFLSLPGLDSIARLAGFVAILFSSFSMASTLVAIFKYKADLERPAAHLGGEGLIMLSRRNIVMSLPLVFLVYAIVAFVAGIVLYSFSGVTASDPLESERPFEDYTKWTVVGVLGGLAGMLTMSLFLLRR